ncbi:hypothetical protein [Nesterenkonia alba]|uniref:PH-like domain-containing protein n=1 Tax=Nesterenkonia alba TaxID=515814 RepID=UPI0003B53F5A|nr:hypothetical protein [Nesterenkonia alba]
MTPTPLGTAPAAAQFLADTTRPEMTGTYLMYLWVSLGVIVVFCLLLWIGWRGRKRRQQGIPEPADVPAQLIETEPQAAAEGMVIGTVKAEDYLDRVAVHELGLRTTGRIEVHDAGVAVFRAGARNVFIGTEDLSYVRTDRGVVGKFVERDGAIIFGWQLGTEEVETAFRPRRAVEGRALLSAAEALTPRQTNQETPHPDQTPSQENSAE